MSTGSPRAVRWLGRLALSSSLCLGPACGSASEAPEQTAGNVESAIIDGVNLSSTEVLNWGTAALYHKHYNGDGSSFWWPRPCSATIVRSISGVSQVLTARHCVTRDGHTNSALLAAADVRVARAAAPGPANPNPPASAVTAVAIEAMPVNGEDIPTRDMAIVRVNVDWSTSVSARNAIFVNNPQFLVGKQITPYGYGLNDDLDCGDNPNVVGGSPGVARRGGPFTVSSASLVAPGGSYVFPNDVGRRVWCGDSGGADIAFLGNGSFGLWAHIAGVHSSIDSVSAYNAVGNLWLQDRLGAYLSPYSNRSLSIGLAGSGIALDTPSDPDHQILTVKYDPTTSQLKNGTNCLNHSLLWAACNGTLSQRWALTSQQKLQNHQTSQCLAHSGSFGVAAQTCSTATADIARRQMWAWHLQI